MLETPSITPASSLPTVPALEDAPRVFRVLACRFEELQAKLARLARRAQKLGVAAPTMREVGRDKDPICNESGRRIGWTEIVLVTVSGEAPKFAGWSILARIERLSGKDGASANLLHALVSDENLPEEYRTAPPACGHCKTRRRRNDTFVVRHDDGRTLQVGSSCLRDFLGHESPEAIASMCECIFSFFSACEDEEGLSFGSREPDAWDLTSYLAWVSVAIRACGWLSRGQVYEQGGQGVATADQAFDLMNLKPAELQKCGVEPPTEEDVSRGVKATAWAKDVQGASDYLHNIRTIATLGVVSARSLGLGASILPAWDRELAREAERKKRAERPVLNEYVGQDKERLRDLKLECVLVRDVASDFGEKHLIGFEDAEGRSFKWWSTSKRLEVGKSYIVTGTVKKHEEYKGRKQTTLTRCDAATEEEIEEREVRAEKFRAEQAAKKVAWKLLKKDKIASGEWVEVRASELRTGMHLAEHSDKEREISDLAGPIAVVETAPSSDVVEVWYKRDWTIGYWAGAQTSRKFKLSAKVLVRVVGCEIAEVA